MTIDLVDLERALAELADGLEFPDASDLPDRVVAELDRPAPVTPLVQRPTVRRVLALAAAAALVAGVVLAASPRARRAVADLLGIGGVAIRTSDTSLSPPATFPPSTSGTMLAASSVPTSAGPGTVSGTVSGGISVEDGASALGVVPPVPSSLGPPEVVTLSDGRLSLQWPPSVELPASDLPGVGALLSVFRGRVEEPLLQKMLEPGTTYERVSVEGRPAVWLAGAPHVLLYIGPNGVVREETLRLAGNTLIWTVGPHTYRLESGLGRDAAIAIAETVPTS